MEGRLKYGFLANHKELIERLEPVELLPFLIPQSVISFEEKELVQHESTTTLKTDRLLTIVHRRAASDPDVYGRLLGVLKDAEASSGQELGDIVKKIEEDSKREDVRRRFQYTIGVLEEAHNAALRMHEQTIVQGLSVDEIMPELISAGVLSLEEKDRIHGGATENEKARRLVNLLYKRGSYVFELFVGVLLKSDSHRRLGELLRKELPGGSVLSGSRMGSVDQVNREELSDEQYVVEVLKRGHIPPRHGVYVERRKMTEKIRRELYKLKDKDGWVVVHGMAGFGKTVLAAEAVRDAKLLREVFPGGVNWLTVGQMTDKNGEVNTANLLIKIQNITDRLDENRTDRYRPTNLEAATDYLQKVISEQHPRSLLILDDVWSTEVAQAFAVRCRTMVTSRNSLVASSVPTPQVFSVSVSEGFSDDEGRILLAQWLRTTPDKLSSHADVILKYCRGSPMAIALIGAMLRKNAREAKWKAIADKLKQKHAGAIHLHASVNDWNYQHPTLNASIELSAESLRDEHLKEYFEMFVVFDYDTFISAEALETIWGTDALDTEEFMMELVGYSLAQQANPGAISPDYLMFYIHDIVLDYLKDTMPKKKQEELHRKVVQRYSDKCSGAFAHLPNDNYVYQKLLGHVAASGNSELLGDLLSHLQWLISSVLYGNANTILANYRAYKSKVAPQFISSVQQFELFVSGHMYVLANEAKQEDIIQLALLQPDTSEMCRQATAMVSGDRKKSWFKWCNKESDPEKYALKLKLHSGGVHDCQYSRDGSKVLSCSSMGDVKLWDASTGMVLADFKGHKDQVTCCAMSSSDKLVVSSSEDLTVKVWDSQSKRLLSDFTQHRYGVQCCAISPDEKLVLSADIDSCCMIWNVHSRQVLAKWRLSAVSPLVSPVVTSEEPNFSPAGLPTRTSSQESQGSGSSEGMLACAFTPDGKSVVTASQRGTIRRWTLMGQFLCSYLGHSGQVKNCKFNREGTLLATACVGDCTAKVWSVSSCSCEVTLAHTSAVLSCDISPDSTRLITGDTEGFVKVWSIAQGTLLQDLPLHWDFVNCVLFSPSGLHILSAADNGLIKILWSEQGGEEEQHDTVQYHRRFSAHFSKLGDSYVPLILCYNLKEKKLQLVQGHEATPVLLGLPTPEGHTPRSWVLSNHGTLVVVGYEDGLLQVISIERSSSAGEEWVATEKWKKDHAHDWKVLKCYFAPDDSKLITCSLDQHKTWSVKDGRELAVISGRGIGVRLCVFFKDSVKVASAQENGVLIWSSATGVPQLHCRGIIQSNGDSILCVNLSEDNTRVVASATSGMIMVWSTATGEPVLKSTVLPLSPCARSCALSPDGSLVAAGFDDGSLQIWSVTRGDQVAYWPTGSDYWMIDVAFSPKGDKVVTLCDTIEWWKTDGTHVKTVLLKGTFGKYIKFSPDFCTFVTIDNAGLLYILTTLNE